MPKFLIPVIGIVLAIAVGVAAAFIAVQFAAPRPVATESAPVLAPVQLDDNGQPVDADGDPATLDVSPAVGSTEIVTPGQGASDGLGADLDAQIEALDAMDGADPGDARSTIGETTPPLGLPADDPCSPTDGAPAADCPDGLHSVILADTAPDALEVFVIADPPASGSIVACPSADVASDALRFGVSTTIPSAITVRYWPQSDPLSVSSLDLSTSASDRSAWDRDFAAHGGYRHNYWIFQHCGEVVDLLPNTTYVASVIAADIFGRLSAPREITFDSRGMPTEPPMTAIPLSPSVLYVSVPITRYEPPLVRAWVVPEGTTPNCQSFDAGLPVLRTVQDQVIVPVTAAYLAARNFDPSYERRLVNVYSVPEGSTLVVCARWFDTTGPSWADTVPTKQRSITVSSPDAVTPVLTLVDLHTSKDVPASSLRLFTTTQMGLECGGGWQGPAEDTAGGSSIDGAGATLCDASATEGYGYAQLGTDRRLVVTSEVTVGSETTTKRFVVNTRDGSCVGICTLPAPSTFVIPLADVTVGTGLCGYNFWESGCTPPTTEQSLGTARLQLSWVQGNRSGLASWQVGGTDERLPESPLRDAPQFNADTFPVAFLASDGWSGGIDYTLTSDRRFHYVVSLIGDCFLDGAITRQVGESAATPLTGSDLYGVQLRFTQLCPGSVYFARVELVDDRGHRTVAGPGDRTEEWAYWPGLGSFVVPYNAIPLTTSVTLDAYTYGTSPDFYAQPYRLSVGDFSREVCHTDSDRRVEVTNVAETAQSRTVHVSIPVTVYRKDGDRDELFVGYSCRWLGEDRYSGTITADLTYEQLRLGTTLTTHLTLDAAGIRGSAVELNDSFLVTVHVQWPGSAGATRR